MQLERIGDAPILTSQSCDRIGDNLNGPSLIRVPDWVSAPLGAHYLYFAHHMGRYIRLAYADQVEGPWKIHRPGALDVSATDFVQTDLSADAFDQALDIEGVSQEFNYAHVASPDVHVDAAQNKIYMYFHGLEADGSQVTKLAMSEDGITFRQVSGPLGYAYFRAFRWRGWVWAIAWGGKLYRARTWDGVFEEGPDILRIPPVTPPGMTLRHAAVAVKDDCLHLIYSLIGDRPERLWSVTIGLREDWSAWDIGTPEMVLAPKLPWEGADLPVQRSEVGAAEGPVHALRDPCLFENYLLYSGAGESAIGLARFARTEGSVF